LLLHLVYTAVADQHIRRIVVLDDADLSIQQDINDREGTVSDLAVGAYGRVSRITSAVRLISMRDLIKAVAIVVVRVESTLALMPLPRPSASTRMVRSPVLRL
jgi:hypothetical protein